jgi:hypothetical protein
MLFAIAKAFGIEPDSVAKDAHTFAEGEAIRDYDKILYDEVYPMGWAFSDSISSIMCDPEKSDSDKAAMMRQSLNEYAAAFGAAIDKWSKAESADDVGKVENVEAILTKMRDNIDSLIKGRNQDNAEDADGSDDDHKDEEDGSDGDEDEPAVKKGVIDMNFDTSKMTPEEKKTFDDFTKRFGSVDAKPPAAVVEPPAPAAQNEGGDDVYKGLHPAVKAELETLRKFREESELRELTEIAKKYTLLGKKPEELAPVLKSLRDAGGTAYADMIGILDSNLATIEKSGVFGEIGKRGNSPTDDAWGKIEAAATEIMKSKADMRWADAIDAACMKHPELVEQYEKARR